MSSTKVKQAKPSNANKRKRDHSEPEAQDANVWDFLKIKQDPEVGHTDLLNSEAPIPRESERPKKKQNLDGASQEKLRDQ